MSDPELNTEARLTECFAELDATREALSETAAQLAERTMELEAERATSHGLRLLLGTCDQVQSGLIKERDEARAEVAGSERERLLAIGGSARLSMELALTNVKLDEARAESARLREALKAVVDADDAESNWAMFAAIGGARQALAKENERGE